MILKRILIFQSFSTQITIDSWCFKMLSFNVSPTIWLVLIIFPTHETSPSWFFVSGIQLWHIFVKITYKTKLIWDWLQYMHMNYPLLVQKMYYELLMIMNGNNVSFNWSSSLETCITIAAIIRRCFNMETFYVSEQILFLI